MAPSKRATSLTPRTCECYLYLYSKRDFGEVMKMGGLSWVIWAGTISNTFSEASAQIFCDIFFMEIENVFNCFTIPTLSTEVCSFGFG